MAPQTAKGRAKMECSHLIISRVTRRLRRTGTGIMYQFSVSVLGLTMRNYGDLQVLVVQVPAFDKPCGVGHYGCVVLQFFPRREWMYGLEGEHVQVYPQDLVGRRWAGYCRICGNAGCDPGSGRRHDTPDRIQRK